MGLDLVLGAFILIWAIRGWFRGFVVQAIGLAALIGCVYLADPVRDALRPYARELLPAIQPPVLDRLLWWASAVGSYVVTSGLAMMIVRLRRRRPYGELIEPNRSDQGAGFLLGAGKGAVACVFLTAAIVQFAPHYVKPGGVVEKQTKASRALAWTARYHPAERIWESAPVQSFVEHVRRRGFWEDGDTPPSDLAEAEDSETSSTAPVVAEPKEPEPESDRPSRRKPVQTANRTPPLAIPRFNPINPESATFLEDVDRAMNQLGLRPSRSR